MTLIELLVSMMLLAVVSLALIQSALVGLNANTTNELRDEAVRVAEDRMSDLRNMPFAAADMQVTAGVNEAPPVYRRVRASEVPFTINRKIVQVDANNRQVTLTVTWSFRNVQYQHGVSTILRAQ